MPFLAPPQLVPSLQVAPECSLAQGGHQCVLGSVEEIWRVASLPLGEGPIEERERERDRANTMEATQVHSFPSSCGQWNNTRSEFCTL